MKIPKQDVINALCFWKGEPSKHKWKLIADNPETRAEAIRRGAMFFTTMNFSHEPKPDNPEPVRAGPLVLDFDCKEDPEEALKDIRKLCLVQLPDLYGVDPNTIEFYASGSKGFHAVIPAACLGDVSGDTHLPLIHKKLVADWKTRFDIKTLDMSLYCMGKGKMFRIFNVRRSNGRYKVPLTLDEVMSLPIDAINRLTESPRRIEPVDGADYDCPDLAEHFRECVVEVKRETSEQTIPVDPERVAKLNGRLTPCMRYVLSDRFKKPDSSTFNGLSLLVVQFFQMAGITLENALSDAGPFLSVCPSSSYPEFSQKIQKFKSQWVFCNGNDQYQWSCRYMLGQGFPGSAFECIGCELCEKSDAGNKPDDSTAWDFVAERFPQQTEFPFHTLPDPLSESLWQLARSCCVSPNAIVAPMFAVICGITGKSYLVSPKSSWIVPMIVWCGDIKSSGQGKSPPVKMLLKPVWGLQDTEDERVRKINEAESRKKPKDQKPVRGQSFLLSELTVETLRVDPGVNGGLLYHPDELSAMINSQNQYKSGGKGTDRESFLRLWSGEKIRIGRVANTQTISVNLNIIGGIPPETFKSVFGNNGGFYLTDGTITRFLWTYEPDSFYPLTNESWSTQNQSAWADIIQAARKFVTDNPEKPHIAIFTSEAFTLFADWRNCLQSQCFSIPVAVRHFLPKLYEYAVRIAGITNLLRCFWSGDNPKPILTNADIQAGIDAAEFYMGHAVAAIRHIKEEKYSQTPGAAPEQVERLARALQGIIADMPDCDKIPINEVAGAFNSGLPKEIHLSAKAMGTFIRQCGMNIPDRLYTQKRVYCLLVNETVRRFIHANT